MHRNALPRWSKHQQDAIFTLDVDGIVTSWNPAAERILGWSFDELVGTDARSIMRGDDAATPVWGADVGPAGISGRHARWLTKAGQPISLRVSASPLRGPDGSWTGTSVMASDVTEELSREHALRESEASLQARTQELAGRNESLREFASVASHDLKEPLRKIRAFGDRLLRREGGC